MLAASLITLLTPLACDWNIYAVIVLRILLGLFLGATWPAMPPMAAKWIPPMERSKFIANMMASSLGAAITMPVCGFLIAYCGWPSVFYLTGKNVFKLPVVFISEDKNKPGKFCFAFCSIAVNGLRNKLVISIKIVLLFNYNNFKIKY